MRKLAEQRAKLLQTRTLSNCLRSQISLAEDVRRKTALAIANAPLDAPFPAEPRRPEIIKRGEDLPEDLRGQIDKNKKRIQTAHKL
jgi:hypothetical protein